MIGQELHQPLTDGAGGAEHGDGDRIHAANIRLEGRADKPLDPRARLLVVESRCEDAAPC